MVHSLQTREALGFGDPRSRCVFAASECPAPSVAMLSTQTHVRVIAQVTARFARDLRRHRIRSAIELSRTEL